jgi:hypothetical protein
MRDVLERDLAKLEEFVQCASTVIYEHLRARGDITAEESEALLDALHALERLQKSKPGMSSRSARRYARFASSHINRSTPSSARSSKRH